MAQVHRHADMRQVHQPRDPHGILGRGHIESGVRVERDLEAGFGGQSRDFPDNGGGLGVLRARLAVPEGQPDDRATAFQQADHLPEFRIVGVARLVQKTVDIDGVDRHAGGLAGGQLGGEIGGIGVVVMDAVVAKPLDGGRLLGRRPNSAADAVVKSEERPWRVTGPGGGGHQPRDQEPKREG